jgi:hypothetical protein
MATLLLENVPDELLRQIEHLAAVERVPVAEKTVKLLQQAVRRESAAERSRVKEILERIRANPIRPSPGMPDVAELLREDRNR